MNAIQAQPQGGSIRVSLERSQSEVRLRFADSGCGIASDELERIFEPFFTTKGTGLGLTVSFCIVRDHGGRIEVESERGQGSRFTVCLPVEAH